MLRVIQCLEVRESRILNIYINIFCVVVVLEFFAQSYIAIYRPPTAQAGCVTKPSIYRSLTCLNSEFSFSETGCHTDVYQSALLFIHSRRKNSWIHTFSKGISAMRNTNSLVLDLNLSRCVYFL